MTHSPTDPTLARPRPYVDALTRPYWEGGAAGELRIRRCVGCDLWHHPPLARCPVCGGRTLVPTPVAGTGTVFTHTVAHHSYRAGQPVPVVIALVELDEQPGLRVTTNIVGCEPGLVHIGMAVSVRFEPLGDGLFAPVFAPVSTPPGLP